MKSKPNPFENEFACAATKYRKMQALIEAIRQKLQTGDIEDAYREALAFADESEKLTLIARQLPAYTGNPMASKMVGQIIEKNTGIHVGFTAKGWFAVTIPAILPKKAKSGSTEYIRDNMYQALSGFFSDKPPVRYSDCVIIFRHVYKRDRPERRYRDHDNIEINMAVDTIAHYVLMDDAPLRCSHYYCSVAGNENRTEIFVVPQREFGTWILDAKSYDGNGIILHEKLQKS
jgi:hypothetical protein